MTMSSATSFGANFFEVALAAAFMDFIDFAPGAMAAPTLEDIFKQWTNFPRNMHADTKVHAKLSCNIKTTIYAYVQLHN